MHFQILLTIQFPTHSRIDSDVRIFIPNACSLLNSSHNANCFYQTRSR